MGKRIAKGVLAVAGIACIVCYGADTLRYIGFGVIRGDWLNDWLTHLPFVVQELVLAIV